MNATEQVPVKESQESQHKLWLDSDWYILVDNHGHCLSENAEGALGFIVKLHHKEDRQSFMALKMPRLMGDTYRENAYIGRLMDQEAKAVRQSLTTTDNNAQIAPSSLLQASQGANDLRGTVNTTRNKEAYRGCINKLLDRQRVCKVQKSLKIVMYCTNNPNG